MQELQLKQTLATSLRETWVTAGWMSVSTSLQKFLLAGSHFVMILKGRHTLFNFGVIRACDAHFIDKKERTNTMTTRRRVSSLKTIKLSLSVISNICCGCWFRNVSFLSSKGRVWWVASLRFWPKVPDPPQPWALLGLTLAVWSERVTPIS